MSVSLSEVGVSSVITSKGGMASVPVTDSEGVWPLCWSVKQTLQIK